MSKANRLLHLKLRVIATEPMTEAEALDKLRRTLRTGIVQKGIDLAWIDWARPRSMMSPPVVSAGDPLAAGEVGRRYMSDEARDALVAFLGAVKHEDSQLTLPSLGEAPSTEPTPRRRRTREDAARLRAPVRARWSIKNYNTFLARAKSMFGLNHKEAQALYREVRDYAARPAYGVDVSRYADLLESDPEAVEESILFEPEAATEYVDEGRPLGLFHEMEVTVRTYKDERTYWRVEIVDG